MIEAAAWWRPTAGTAPFHLDDDAVDWVFATFDTLDLEDKIGQTLLPLVRDLSPEAMDRLLQQRVGGAHRIAGRSRESLRDSAERLQSGAKVPLLLSADLEFSEKGSFGEGTRLTNQMGVAATGSLEDIERMAAIAAIEGRALGYSWSFTPVVDLDLNFRNSVVNTRSFGADPRQVAQSVSLYIQAMQKHGMAACAKHWPGDGCDERDQHFVTSANSLTADEWEASFGMVFREAVAAGVKTIMAGHIALPAFQSEPGKPSSLDPDLMRLLRMNCGFQGLIVSDAIGGMGGFVSQGERKRLVPMCLEAGCDILLFPEPLEDDFEHLRQGLRDGLLSRQRLDEAVFRILAFKASLGLHRNAGLPEDKADFTSEHKEWARDIAERSITVVHDRPGLLPLNPKQHKRVLLLQTPERFSPSGPLPQLEMDRLLREAGFEVEIYQPPEAGTSLTLETVDASRYDVAIYLIAEEGLSAKQGLRIDWTALHGRFPNSMTRMWHSMPTVMVSFGSPYHLFEAPDCPTLINAYSAVPDVQRAVVAALTGAIPATGRSPVDTSAGLDPGVDYGPRPVLARALAGQDASDHSNGTGKRLSRADDRADLKDAH